MATVRKEDTRQEEVVCASPAAKTIVIAGPGTGKTEVAALRLLHLFSQGLRPSQILVLSFSNSAVRTLTRRMESQAGMGDAMLEDLRYLSIRTFDSWTFRMLRQLGDVPRELMARNYDENIAELIQRMEGSQADPVREQLKNIQHVVVDEFQDLAGVRGALVVSLLRLLSGNAGSNVGFTVLGDDAQAIYGFSVRRSMSSEFSHVTTSWLLSQLRAQHPQVQDIELDKNYRAVKELADLARKMRAILRQDGTGAEKVDAMTSLLSVLPELDGTLSHDAMRVFGDSGAILTRTNGEALRVAQQLGGTENRAAMKVILGSGGKQRVTPGWVGALLGRVKAATVTHAQFSRVYQHISNGDEGISRAAMLCMPAEPVAWMRLVRAAGLAPDATAFELKHLRERMGWLDAFPDDEGMRDNGVRVLTIHQSKGMEFDSVAILESPDRASNNENNDRPSDDESAEEASVVFVAITRAGSKLLRIPANATYPLFQWRYPNGGSRWYSQRNGWLNVELGQPRDIAPTSFVDTRLHEGATGVMELQNFLADQAGELAGRKVMLKKISSPDNSRDKIYAIHLQEGTAPGRLLGATTCHMTMDLLGLIWSKGFGLPSTLMNLRIAQVVTLQGSADVSTGVASDFASSGVWLGLQLYGVGFCKVFKRGPRA